MPLPARDLPSRPVPVVRVTGTTSHESIDAAAVEEPLQVVVNGRPFAVIMRTPGEDEALAAGFLVAERVLRARAELLAVRAPPVRDGIAPHNVIEVELDAVAAARLDRVARSVTTSTSCGLCGRQRIESLATDGLQVGPGRVVDPAVLVRLPGALREVQHVFDRTGGLHAAGLFDPGGRLIAAAEDVGRHNAVDKVLGARWLAGDWPLAGGLLLVSGRVSYEIALKALVAGIPVLAAVSAPSTLAIDLAQRTGMSLVAFVRDGRVNVYAHGHRVAGPGRAAG